jgi:hypothetical protein
MSIYRNIARQNDSCDVTLGVIGGVVTSVDGRVDGDGPHGGGVTVAVAVVILAAVTAGPHVDVTQPVATLKKGKQIYVTSYIVQI